jgi:hypothetical protein
MAQMPRSQPFSVPDPLAEAWDAMVRLNRRLQAQNDPLTPEPARSPGEASSQLDSDLRRAEMPNAQWQALRQLQVRGGANAIEDDLVMRDWMPKSGLQIPPAFGPPQPMRALQWANDAHAVRRSAPAALSDALPAQDWQRMREQQRGGGDVISTAGGEYAGGWCRRGHDWRDGFAEAKPDRLGIPPRVSSDQIRERLAAAKKEHDEIVNRLIDDGQMPDRVGAWR